MSSATPPIPHRPRRGIRFWLGRAWAELVDATEWFSHGGRLRPHYGERSSIFDPTSGSGPPDAYDDEMAAEHGGDRPEE